MRTGLLLSLAELQTSIRQYTSRKWSTALRDGNVGREKWKGLLVLRWYGSLNSGLLALDPRGYSTRPEFTSFAYSNCIIHIVNIASGDFIMSIVKVDAEAAKVSLKDVVDIAATAGLKLSEQTATDFVTLVSGLEAVIASLPDDSCIIPIPDLSRYPRKDIHMPQDNDLGGWAAKVRDS